MCRQDWLLRRCDNELDQDCLFCGPFFGELFIFPRLGVRCSAVPVVAFAGPLESTILLCTSHESIVDLLCSFSGPRAQRVRVRNAYYKERRNLDTYVVMYFLVHHLEFFSRWKFGYLGEESRLCGIGTQRTRFGNPPRHTATGYFLTQ